MTKSPPEGENKKISGLSELFNTLLYRTALEAYALGVSRGQDAMIRAMIDKDPKKRPSDMTASEYLATEATLLLLTPESLEQRMAEIDRVVVAAVTSVIIELVEDLVEKSEQKETS